MSHTKYYITIPCVVENEGRSACLEQDMRIGVYAENSKDAITLVTNALEGLIDAEIDGDIPRRPGYDSYG